MERLVSLVLAISVLTPAAASAQASATVQGTVTDESKAALPGVTVTALEPSTGRQFAAITDGRGEYRLVNVSAGVYKIQAELAGFATVVISGLEVLVGQNADVPITMKLAAVEETVTVTGESPLVNTNSSQVATNVDRRQMEELPLQGRNWMELALLSKGVTANSADNSPGVRERDFNLSLDGSQIIQNRVQTAIGQPKFSREAIAEFQLITNLFDVTQGRSTGVQVQAVTRAGSNRTSGAFYTYFRSDKLNAPDPIVKTVVPYENQQIGGAFGGPILKDKLLYYVSYEYEREPQTVILKPPSLPNQTFIFPNKLVQHSATARVDHNLSARNHLMYRASYWTFTNPFYLRGGTTTHPSAANNQSLTSINGVATWSQVLSNTKVQELKVGFNGFYVGFTLLYPAMNNIPTYSFPGISFGGSTVYPQRAPESTPTARYDLNWHKDTHDIKLGSEFLHTRGHGGYSYSLRGSVAFSRALPTADLERRFPADSYANPAAWDLSGLDSLVRQVDQNVGDNHIDYDRPILAAWIGDSWRVTDRMVVNYGVRWDVDWGVASPPIDDSRPFLPFNGPLWGKGIVDYGNIGPRTGFTYRVSDKNDFIIRGGSGVYYNFTTSQTNTQSQFFHQLKTNTYINDGRPGFLANPTRNYTQAQIEAGNTPQKPVVIAHDLSTPYAIQTAIGFQKQIGSVTGVEADLTHLNEFNALRGRDINLFYDPVTGYNLDPIAYGRPDPYWNEINWIETTGRAESLLLSSSVTRRLQKNFQGALSYTRTFRNKDNFDNPFGTISANNQFDLNGDWGNSAFNQRDTLRAYAIVNLPVAMSFSAIYSYGSGNHYGASVVGTPYNKPGSNRLNIGAPIMIPANVVDRFEGPAVVGTGQAVPRNALRGLPIHKVDFRLTKQFSLGGSRRLSGIAEVFNVFNHDNYGSYNSQINSATFGQPVQNPSSTYRSRTGQLAFRMQF
jgi:hypothetical protein